LHFLTDFTTPSNCAAEERNAAVNSIVTFESCFSFTPPPGDVEGEGDAVEPGELEGLAEEVGLAVELGLALFDGQTGGGAGSGT
jgi:hypothetical protein